MNTTMDGYKIYKSELPQILQDNEGNDTLGRIFVGANKQRFIITHKVNDTFSFPCAQDSYSTVSLSYTHLQNYSIVEIGKILD